MTDNTGSPHSQMSGPSQSGSNVTMYVLFGVVGLVVGFLISMALGGGKGGSDPVVAEYNGQSLHASEAFAPIKTRLFDLEEEVFRTKEQAINDYIEQKLLEGEARKQNMTVDQLLDKEAGAQAAAEISDKDIETFLTSKGLSLNDPRIRKEDVRQYLKYRQKFEKRQAYVTKLRETAHVKLDIEEPSSPHIKVATDGYPSWGNPKAPVTIAEFSDFQCPFCARAVPTLNQIKQTFGPDKVHIVFRFMPLPSHNRAVPAAVAATCANEQGKFWEMHDVLFQNQQHLEDADLKNYAKQVGLDLTKFDDCYSKKKYMSLIDQSRKEGEAVGISATPSFVINGSLMQGAQPFEQFKEKIERLEHS